MLDKQISIKKEKSEILTKPITYFLMVLCAYLCMAWLDEGYSHPDEHFQILELATYKNHTNLDGLPWEFVKEVRPTIQAWTVILFFKILSYFVSQVSPFLISFLTKALAAFLSALSCILFYISFRNELETTGHKQWFFLFTAFNYVTFCHASHFSSEIISADFFIIGLALLFYKPLPLHYLRYALAGVLFGFAFITRYQTGIMLFGLFAWLLWVQKISLKSLILLVGGVSLVFLLGIGLDSLFYGHLICTAWRYLYFNLIAGYAKNFGTSHWTYFQTLYALPFGPLYFLGSIYFMLKKPLHVITWIMLPFLVIHQLIGHKEIRFLFPLMGFIPFILISALQIWQNKNLKKYSQTWIYTIWYINIIPIIFHVVTHYHLFDIYHYLWQNRQNQTIALYRYSPPNQPVTDFGLPLEFYFPNNILLQNYSELPIESRNTHLKWVMTACSQSFPYAQNAKLIYDSCSPNKLISFYNYFTRTKRSFLYRYRGQIYQI